MATLKESIDLMNRTQIRLARQLALYSNYSKEQQKSLMPIFYQMEQSLDNLKQTINSTNRIMNDYKTFSMNIGNIVGLKLAMFRETIERIPTAAELGLEIPEHVIDNLNRTIETIDPLLERDDDDPYPQQVINNYNITINNYQSNPSKDWIGLLGFILALITFIYGVQQNHNDSIERNQDRMIQQQHFEEFIKVSNDLIDAVHPVIYELPISEPVQDQHAPE